MKKLICTILTILMLPLACFTLTACGKEDYQIKEFYLTYKNIESSVTNLELVPANDIYQVYNNSYKIDIKYSNSTKLSDLVDQEGTEYYNLKHFYQQLLDDSLSPLYFFGESISESKNVSKNQTKQLFVELKNLEEDYKDIDFTLVSLINSLNLEENSTISLSYLKKVFTEYEQAISTANRLSTIVCDVYFNSVVSNSNYNYSIKNADELTTADLTRIATDVRKRMYYYKSVYANIYNQLYLKGSNLSTLLSGVPNVTTPTYTPYNNLKSITSLTNNQASWTVNQESIYNYAISLYNIQNSFTEAYNKFTHASSQVVYCKINNFSSATEQNYAQIITQFSEGIAVDSYEVMTKLIDLLYS
jgi:hypothetical protein